MEPIAETPEREDKDEEQEVIHPSGRSEVSGVCAARCRAGQFFTLNSTTGFLSSPRGPSERKDVRVTDQMLTDSLRTHEGGNPANRIPGVRSHGAEKCFCFVCTEQIWLKVDVLQRVHLAVEQNPGRMAASQNVFGFRIRFCSAAEIQPLALVTKRPASPLFNKTQLYVSRRPDNLGASSGERCQRTCASFLQARTY